MYNVQTAIPRPICLCRRFNSTLMKTWQGEHFWDADTRRGCGCGNGHVLSCLSWWPANKTNCTSSEARRPRVRGHSQEQHARSQVLQPAASSTACQCCCHSRSVAVSEKKPGQIQAKSESKTTFAARSICGNAILSLFMDLAAHATCTPAKRTSDVAAVSVDVAVAAMLLLPRLLRSPLLLQHPPL